MRPEAEARTDLGEMTGGLTTRGPNTFVKDGSGGGAARAEGKRGPGVLLGGCRVGCCGRAGGGEARRWRLGGGGVCRLGTRNLSLRTVGLEVRQGRADTVL